MKQVLSHCQLITTILQKILPVGEIYKKHHQWKINNVANYYQESAYNLSDEV